MLRKLREQISRLRRCKRGVAFIEFAFTLPILIVMFVGVVEVVRYAIILQKAEKTVNMVGDTVAIGIPKSEEGAMFLVANNMMEPFGDPTNYKIIVTLFHKSIFASSPRLYRTIKSPGYANIKPQIETLPEGFSVQNGGIVVVSEIFFGYEPILVPQFLWQFALGKHEIYRKIILKNRA